MTCNNSTTNKEATNKALLEEADKEWEKMWKDNPPKYEGKIRIGGNGEGFHILSSIFPAMYPYILISLQENEPRAFAEAISMIIERNFVKSFSCFINESAKTFDDDSEDSEMEETPE